ncbi:homoserine O-acetyltransferase/O-succinyltransferase family protein [Nicoliella lavandulae]|uniref:Homoserine O-acetyltransferase n=1 Tax=Nicoliella lavandulae TaxID=3082954 RepID=A0ABU8SMG2_9LACO
MTVNVKNGFLKASQEWVDQKLNQPLKILVLNLMPTKKQTELQFLNILNALDHDIEVTFIYPATHHFKTIDRAEVEDCYCSLNQISDHHYDGLIITGAPVEQIDFESVDYWDEFVSIKRWAQTHVGQTINECWAAQAALYDDFAIDKCLLPQKLFGIYQATAVKDDCQLSVGLEHFTNPQSRHSASLIDRKHLPNGLNIVADNPEAGPLLLHSDVKHQTYVTGHPEYLTRTLNDEYLRDIARHAQIKAPVNYYDQNHHVRNTWQSSSIRLYQNWINLIESEALNYDQTKITI